MDFNPLPGFFEELLSRAHMAFPLVGPFLGTLGAFYFQGWRTRQNEWRKKHTSAEYAYFVLESHKNILTRVWEHQLEAHSNTDDRHLTLKNLHFESEVMPIDFPSLRFVLDSDMPEVMTALFEADHNFIGFVHTLKRRNDEYFRVREAGENPETSKALQEVTESLYRTHDKAVEKNELARHALSRFLSIAFQEKI